MTSSDLLNNPTAQQLVRGCAERYGKTLAVVNTYDSECSLTYAQLAEIVFTAAASLEERVRGRVVIVRGAVDEHLVVDLLSLLCAGAIVHAVPDSCDALDIQRLARATGAVAVRVPQSDGSVEYSGLEEIAPRQWDNGSVEPTPQSPDDVAFYFHTSGTTGLPKIAVLTHRAVFSDAAAASLQILDPLGIEPGTCTVPLLPPYHVLGSVLAVLTALEHGYTLGCAHSLRNVPAVLQHYHPDTLLVVPMILEGLWKLSQSPRIKASGLDLQTLVGGDLRHLICGAASLPTTLAKSFANHGIEIFNGYGMTECSAVVSCRLPPNDPPTSVGRSLDEVIQVRVLDGELQISGATLMSGYLVDGKLDRSPVESGWFATGDLARVDDDGFIHLTGRSKNIIILPDGNNISPEEIERELHEHSGIAEAIVSAEPIGFRGQEVLAVTCVPSERDELTPGSQASLTVVREVPQDILDAVAAVNRAAPAYRQIRVVRLAPENVARSPLGKIVRRELTWPIGDSQ